MLNGTGHVLVSMFSSTLSKTSIAGAVARVSIPTVAIIVLWFPLSVLWTFLLME